MKIKVTKDLCEIKENEIWNVGDYNVHTVQVELSPEFNGLVNKVRYFVEDNSYDMLITDNVAQVPYEATVMEGTIKIGVYGYDADTDILVQSTSPVNKYITSGTYTGDPDNTQPLTPTDKEQMETAIQKNTNDIIDLKANKQDKLISGVNIKTINNESILSSGNLTLVTEETDPIFTNSPAYSITDNDITYWNNKLDQSDLTDYIKNTDYASNNTGGVIKTGNALDVDANGVVTATVQSYADYSSGSNIDFISKGTLENVITGKNLETANNKVTSISSSSTDVQYPSAKCVYDNDVIIKDDVNTKYDYLFSLTNLFGKITGTGTSVTLNDTSNTIMKLNLDTTTSSQVTTTGKNLFNESLLSTSINGGLTWEYENQKIKLSGTATRDYSQSGKTNINLQAGTYAFTLFSDSSLNFGVWIYNSDNQLIANSKLNNPFTINEEATSIGLFVEGLMVNTAYNLEINIQIERNSSTGTYEPYTGGQPAPSPSYPQTVHTISGNNDIKINNKNLLNITTFSDDTTTKTTNGITATIKDGKIHISGTSSARTMFTLKKNDFTVSNEFYYYCNSISSVARLELLCKVDGATKYLNSFSAANFQNATTSFEYTRLYVVVENGQTVNHTFTPMVVEGSTLSQYEPYKQQTYSVNLGDIELCKIGNYQDVLFKNTINSEYYNSSLELNKWYKHAKIGKVVLDGSEDWALHNSSTETKYRYWLLSSNFTNVFTNAFTGSESLLFGKILCNMETQALFENTAYGKFSINTSTPSNSWFLLNFDNSSITTLENFKTWLSTHNTIVYYVLETPTYTLLNDTLQTQLNNMQYALAYDTQTNISQTNNDLPFIINAETYKEIDLTNYVKNTDYASSSTGGVIKTGNYFQVNSSGQTYADTINYSAYQSVSNATFISKGTLENVLRGYGLIE